MTERWLEEAYADYHGWKGWGAGRDAEGEVARALAELKMAECRRLRACWRSALVTAPS